VRNNEIRDAVSIDVTDGKAYGRVVQRVAGFVDDGAGESPLPFVEKHTYGRRHRLESCQVQQRVSVEVRDDEGSAGRGGVHNLIRECAIPAVEEYTQRGDVSPIGRCRTDPSQIGIAISVEIGSQD
jgi:hypothetical protein